MADESDWLLDEYLYPTPFSDVDPVEEILPEFLFRNEVRGPMIVFGQFADSLSVGLTGDQPQPCRVEERSLLIAQTVLRNGLRQLSGEKPSYGKKDITRKQTASSSLPGATALVTCMDAGNRDDMRENRTRDQSSC